MLMNDKWFIEMCKIRESRVIEPFIGELIKDENGRNSYSVMGKLSDREVKRLRREVKDGLDRDKEGKDKEV